MGLTALRMVARKLRQIAEGGPLYFPRPFKTMREHHPMPQYNAPVSPLYGVFARFRTSATDKKISRYE